MKIARRLLTALALLLVAILFLDVVTFDRRAWIADYDAIRAGMAQHYANLDRPGIDPKAINDETARRLDGAFTRIQAYRALTSFAAAFGDPHLKLDWGRHPLPAKVADGSQPAEPPAGDSCQAAGYAGEAASFAPRMAELAGWRSFESGAFPIARARNYGVLRIASFREQDYPEACARAFKPGMDQRALQLATRAELQKELRQSIDRLRRTGARRLLIDLTGNGGGSEWDVEAAALFTPRAMVRQDPRVANAKCDRGLIWKGARPSCSVFASAPTTTTIAGKGAWGGPVVILADAGTASAAEEFIGWLVDNRVARLAGETTMGAGCGYIDGGAPVVLKAAPLTFRMPNCARFTRGGRNEIDGFEPTIAAPMPKPGEEQSWGLALSQALGA